MTIRANRIIGTEPATTTQATAYYQQLGLRLDSQMKLGVPRSQGAWGAEQQRLGSWGSGVGRLGANGMGAQYQPGVGQPSFVYDPDEIRSQP